MDAMEYMFFLAREDSSNVLEFKPECILMEDLMSLSSKFPLIPGSQRSITFCTTPLSQKLREIPLDADFDLTDPCSPPPMYNVLHDPHLKEYFQNAAMRKRLVEKGFITPSGFVKCTLLEFNMFRQWIRKLKLDQIHQEWRRQRHIEKQQWKERQAREQLLRDEELYSIVREREQKARELKERGKKRREADRRKYIRLQEKDRRRREKHLETMKRKKDINESHRERIVEKKQAGKVEEEEKVKKVKIKLLVKRNSEDREREIMLQKRRQTLIEEKEKKLKENWKRRCSLSLDRQEEKRKREEAEREQHVRNVERRTSLVAQQRRRSQVYHDMCLQRIRVALEKQHQEAENFLEKMRERKVKELEIWKQKHSRMRKKHMQQSRRVSFPHKSSGPDHRRRSRLSSVWDLQESLKREFGIDDNVVYSGFVFASRKTTQGARERAQLKALAEEETSGQDEESDQFERLLSRLEEEFALREKVHDVVFSIISNAQNILDLEKGLEIAREIPDYVESIVKAAIRTLSNLQTGDGEMGINVREYVLGMINNAVCVVDDLSTERAKKEIQCRKSHRDTAKEIVATAINTASQKALSYDSKATLEDKDSIASVAAQDISESLSECAKNILTVAIVASLRLVKDERELAAARRLATEAVEAAKASLQQLYGGKLQLFEVEQEVTNNASKSLDKCAKDMAAAAIISATKSLERAITKDDNCVIAARSLAVDAVTAAKASLEKLHGVRVEITKEVWDSSIDISKCLRKFARDISQAVISSAAQPSESPVNRAATKDDHRVITARSLAFDAVTAAKTSLEKLHCVRVEVENEEWDSSIDISKCPRKSATDISQAVISSTAQLLEEPSEGSINRTASKDDHHVIAARSLAVDAVAAARSSLEKLHCVRVKVENEESSRYTSQAVISATAQSPESPVKRGAQTLAPEAVRTESASQENLHGIKIDSEDKREKIETNAKKIAAAAIISATRTLEEDSECSKVDLAAAAAELSSNAVDSAKASMDWFRTRKIVLEASEDPQKLLEQAVKNIAEVAVDLATQSLEHLAEKNERNLTSTTRELVNDVIESATASLERLYGIKVEPVEKLKLTSQETSIISSVSESSENTLSAEEREKELKVAARGLALDATKSAKESLERLYGIVNEMEEGIKSTALEISKSLVNSSGNVRQWLEEQGLAIAARDLACCAIESAAQSILKLHEDMPLQDIVGSDYLLLETAGKVSTISARASLGELFDRGFIGGVELEEATGYIATHALTSAQTMLEKEQGNSNTVDLDLEICKAASLLAIHAVPPLVQTERPNASERGCDHGTTFWKVSTYVEGIVNGAFRRVSTTGYVDDLRDDTEQYEMITYDQARTADAEYGQNKQNLYDRELLALRASRIVNDLVQNAMESVKMQRANNAFFSIDDCRPGNDRFARRRSSSVHFNEGSMFHSSRDSYVGASKRPPTPHYRKRRAESVVSQEIPSDRELSTSTLNFSASVFVQRRSSDPGRSFGCNSATTSELERSESDSRIYHEDQGNSLTQKVSLYEVIKKREGTASCEISPCGSYVVLPHLNPSECSLIASRVEAYETLSNQTKTSSSVTSLPSLSSKGSFVTRKGVEQVSQSKEPENRLEASSRLPDISNISNTASKFTKGSLSASSLKQSPEHPKRTLSLQFKKSSPKPSTETSKGSAKLASKFSSGKDLQSPRGSVGKVIASPRTSQHAQEGSHQRLSKTGTEVSPKHSLKDEPPSQQSSAAKKIHPPENSLTRVSPVSSLEKAGLPNNSISQSKFKSSTKTSILYGHPSTEKLIMENKTRASSKTSLNKTVLKSSLSAEKANLSLSASKGKVVQSPRVSREKVAVSSKKSIESVTKSLQDSIENAAMSAVRSSQGSLKSSRRASTDSTAITPSESKGKMKQPTTLPKRVSKANSVQFVRASTEKLVLSTSFSEGNVTQSPVNAASSLLVSNGNVRPSQGVSGKNGGLSPKNSKPNATQFARTSTENVALPLRVSKEKIKTPQRASTESAKLSTGVTKRDVLQSSEVSAEQMLLSSQSPEEKVASRTSAEKLATCSSGLTEKVMAKVILPEDNKTIESGRTREQNVSSEDAGRILCPAIPSKTMVNTPPIQPTNGLKSDDVIPKTQLIETTPIESSQSEKNVGKESDSSSIEPEKAPDSTKRNFQDNEILANSSTSEQGKPLASDASQMQGVGLEPDQPGVRKDGTVGDSHQTNEGQIVKTLQNVVPSLERVIQDKRLTPEGAEAETRPASSADVLRKYTCPEQPQKIVSVKEDQSEGLKASTSKFPRTSHDLLEPNRSYGDEFVTLRKKPEGEDRGEVQGISVTNGSVSSNKEEEKKESDSKICYSSSKQQIVKSTRSVNEVKSFPAYRKVSISRSVQDTVDDIVQRMLATADEQGITRATCPKGPCSEMKRESEPGIGRPRGFVKDGSLPTCKVSKTVRETVDFMVQAVSSPYDRRSPRSSRRRLFGSDVQAGYEIQRRSSSVERFSRNTPSVQDISCTYGVSPSPPKVPSPKRSRLRTNPSQDFMLLRPTQSDSSVASLSSDKAADLKPKVSGAWLDDVMVGCGDASVRSQSPKRPHSSPTPSLRKRSSGRLSFRYSLEGVATQKDNVMEK